jgi:hypothetical protein
LSAVELNANQVPSTSFVIDESKPYVYIQFDHFGPRRPVNSRESTKGIWLRLVNNCRLPISVSVLDPGTGDPGVILNYEVVPAPGPFAPDAQLRRSMPSGYSADIGTGVTVAPTSDLLSVPAESVAQQWYIQVRFNLVLLKMKTVGTLPGHYDPYSVVDFTWHNVAEATRRGLPIQPESRRGELAK